MIESSLFTDIQTLPPVGYCPRCGGEVYAPGARCGCGEGEA